MASNFLLLSQLDRSSFESTVNQLNTYFAEAEKGSCSTYCEGCLACLTAYLVYICSETHYEKVQNKQKESNSLNTLLIKIMIEYYLFDLIKIPENIRNS